jgi:hypothetical protein
MKVRITFDISERARKGIWMYHSKETDDLEDGHRLKLAPYDWVKSLISQTVATTFEDYAYGAQRYEESLESDETDD